MKAYGQFFYNIRHYIPTIGLAGATIFGMSCDKAELRTDTPPTPTPQPVERHNVELVFEQGNRTMLSFDTLKKYINDNSVDTVYMTATGKSWRCYAGGNIQALRHNFLEPRLSLSPKVRGRGDFNFELGSASKLPADSLWYVEQGWTINNNRSDRYYNAGMR